MSSSANLPSTQKLTSVTGYPRARLKQEAKRGDTIKPCFHCGQALALNRWDSWNGFLVQCPHCGGLHGKRWHIYRFLLASFVFHAISFLFTMRPPKSFLAMIGFIVFAVGANYLVVSSEAVPDLIEIAVAAIVFLGPMLINAVILIKHERDLDSSAPPTQPLRG